MTLLPASTLAALQRLRASQMTDTASVRRSPGGRQTGDQRAWPEHHTEAGLLKASRDTVQDASGRLVAQSAPVWVTDIASETRAGDLLVIGERWFTVAGPARAQTVQTAAEFALVEVVYGS